jgi:DNA-binding MarR family transcriptional regulator
VTILAEFADQHAKTQKEIIVATGLSRQLVAPLLKRLVAAGELTRPAHGVYLASSAPLPDLLPSSNPMGGRFDKALLAYLSAPHTIREATEELRVSRQALERALKRLESQGLIKRLAAREDSAAHVFIRSDAAEVAVALSRRRRLSEIRSRTLSSLAPSELHRIDEVARSANLEIISVRHAIQALEQLGYISVISFGARRYVKLEPEGEAHPNYDLNRPKAKPANLAEDYGTRRAQFLQILSVLAPLQTSDMTYALPEGTAASRRHGSGQVIQCLRDDRLIEVCEHRDGRFPTYRLTTFGKRVVASLNAASPPPEPAMLRARIKAGRAIRLEQLAEARRARFVAPG